MIGPPVAHPHAQAHGPHVQRRVFLAAAAPGRAVVPEQLVGQSLAAKGPGQLRLHRALFLIRTGGQQHVVAGMIVEHAQRMAAARIEGEVPLEIHLPELVGAGPFETREGRGRRAGRRGDEAMPGQDAGERAGRRQAGVAEILETAAQLARAPGGMRAAQRHHRRLHGANRAFGTALRPAGTVRQGVGSARLETFEPLVAHGGADLETTAELPDVGVGQPGQMDKFQAHRKQIIHKPGHGYPPCRHTAACVHHVPAHPSTLSPVYTRIAEWEE